MLVEEKLQLLIELHAETQHFLDLYNWGKEHDLETETMQSFQPYVETLNAVQPVLEKEIRNNDCLPREPDRDASDIEQLFILFQKEIFEDAGKLHSEHLRTSRNKIEELAGQCRNHEYSSSAHKAIIEC